MMLNSIFCACILLAADTRSLYVYTTISFFYVQLSSWTTKLSKLEIKTLEEYPCGIIAFRGLPQLFFSQRTDWLILATTATKEALRAEALISIQQSDEAKVLLP